MQIDIKLTKGEESHPEKKTTLYIPISLKIPTKGLLEQVYYHVIKKAKHVLPKILDLT